MFRTVSTTEGVFLLALILGMGVSVTLLADALGDWRFQRRAKRNGARLTVAWGNVRREAERTAIYAVLLALGVFLGARAPVDPARPVTAGGVALAASILFVVFTMVGGSVLDRIERRKLIAYVDRQEGAGQAGAIPVDD